MTRCILVPRRFAQSIRLSGTLSEDDDDGSENVGKKMNVRSFKLSRVYLDPLNMLINVRDLNLLIYVNY